MGWIKLLGEISRKLVKQVSRSPLAVGEDEPWVLLLQALLSSELFRV